jgi:hypothetical protein
MRTETDPITKADAYAEWSERHGESGRLGERVAKLLPAVDDAYWQYANDQGLEQEHVASYLERFPDGVHAADATRRIDQLRYFAQKAAERAEAQRLAEEDERRRAEEENERQRALVRGGLERWLRTALDLPRWGTTVEALAALDEGFREQWSGDPEPVCVQSTCRRTVRASYFFAQAGGTRIDRSLSLVLQVDTRDGRVYQLTAYYTGRGFVDWLEMGSDAPIVNESSEDREMARDAMMAMVQGAVSMRLPTASEVETEERGVLLRFASGDITVTLREFPPDFAAGRVDGVQVTFAGSLVGPAEPQPDAGR